MDASGTAVATKVNKHRFTVSQYEQMGKAGIFGEDDRVELVEGDVVEMAAIGERHAACVNCLNDLFWRTLGGAVLLGVQNPMILDESSEPQPDVVLLRRQPDYFRSAHPRPSDAYLVVEVADTTIDFDRRVKAPIYARNGVAELWIVDIVGDGIIVYRDPMADGYATTLTAHRGETLSPLAFPDCQVAVAEVLG